jgi:hypothetical protein
MLLAGIRLLRPPLKKKVTWAYFSVSAQWNWRMPRLAEDRPSVTARHPASKAKGSPYHWSYSIMQVTSAAARRRGRSRRSRQARAATICRGRSLRKLKNTTGSSPSRSPRQPAMTLGRMNSSSRRRRRPASMAARAERARPLPCTMASPGALGAVPALIPIHGVVAPADGGEAPRRRPPAPPRRRRGRLSRLGGVSRPSVIMCSSGAPLCAAQLDQRHQVAHVAVHAAVGDQPQQVQRSPCSALPCRSAAISTGLS